MQDTISNAQINCESLMTYADVARYLKRSQSSLRHDVQRGPVAGNIPYLKIGKLVRFKKSAVDEWLNDLEVRYRG